MVEQMVSSNLTKYGLGKCATIIATSDNQPVPAQLVSVNDSTTKNMQSDNKNGPPRPLENSAILHKEEAVTRPAGSNNVNRNLVYARRKSDAELSNARTMDKNRTSGFQQAEQLGDKKDGPQMETKHKGIPVNSIATRISNGENEQSVVVKLPALEDWKTRFVNLQKYLKQCDGSNHEVYLQKLQSFSPDECSRHAVELEKRTIRLTMDEGREIQRVKDLNVLGKSGGNHLLFRPPTPLFKSENLM